MNCLYILDINLTWVTSFANIFSHSVGYLFVFSVVSFAVQKLLIRSHLLFLLLSLPLPEEIHPTSRSVLPTFSLGVLWFPVLHLGL